MGKGFAMRVEREEFQKYEDIDLIALFKVVWVGKWKIIFVTGIAAILSVFYALSLPNIYKSEVLEQTKYTKEDCDHVTLHSQIKKNGYKVWLNPSQITLYTKHYYQY